MTKHWTLVPLLAWSILTPATAALYTSPFSPGSGAGSGVIPDANPNGWYDSRSVTLAGTITDVQVGLTLSDGNNSDLYAYLVHVDTSGQAHTVVLMNRIGITSTDPFGNTGAGMNVTLSDSGSQNIQNMNGSSYLTGTYHAAGNLSGFDGSGASGSWTLFFADLSGGDQSTVTSWSLDVTAVPEPVVVALGICGMLFGCGAMFQNWRTNRRQNKRISELEKSHALAGVPSAPVIMPEPLPRLRRRVRQRLHLLWS